MKTALLFSVCILVQLVSVRESCAQADSNQVDTAGKRHGYWHTKTKKSSYKGHYVNGKRTGYWEKTDRRGRLVVQQYFSEEGELDSTLQYEKGKPYTGDCSQDEPGEGPYSSSRVYGYCLNGQRHGKWATSPYIKRAMVKTLNYSHGKLHGPCELFIDSLLLYRVHYVDGVLDGPCVLKYDLSLYGRLNHKYEQYMYNGNYTTTGEFVNGKQHGLWKHVDDEGLPEYEADYVNGAINGYERYYTDAFFDSAGYRVEYVRAKYPEDSTRKKEVYLYYQCAYRNGVKHGNAYSFKWTGDTTMGRTYQEGNVNGKQWWVLRGGGMLVYTVDHNRLLNMEYQGYDSLHKAVNSEFSNGNGIIHFGESTYISFFLGAVYSDYNYPPRFFGDQRYIGYLELENGRIKPGHYYFKGYHGGWEYVFTFTDTSITKKMLKRESPFCCCPEHLLVDMEVEEADAVVVGIALSEDLLIIPDSAVHKMFPDDSVQSALLSETNIIRRYDLLVEKVYKGEIRKDTVIIYSGFTEEYGAFEFEVGKKYIVYGEKNAHLGSITRKGESIFWTHQCRRTRLYNMDEIGELEQLFKPK